MYILVCIYVWIYEGLLFLEYLDICIRGSLGNYVQNSIMNIWGVFDEIMAILFILKFIP